MLVIIIIINRSTLIAFLGNVVEQERFRLGCNVGQSRPEATLIASCFESVKAGNTELNEAPPVLTSFMSKAFLQKQQQSILDPAF